MRLTIPMLAMLMLVGWQDRLLAQPTCNQLSEHRTSDYRRSFRISNWNLGDLSGVSATEAARAIVAGASAWNEQSNARPFIYTGTTWRSDLPMDKASCDAQLLNYSMVIVSDEPSDNFALAMPRCIDPLTSRGEQFLIRIYRRNMALNLYQWETNGSSIDANELDLVGTATHEFGHTLNIAHTPSSTFGVMSPASPAPWPSVLGESRLRDLYTYELHCAKEIAGDRQTRARRRLHTFTGFWPEDSYLGATLVANVSAAVTWLPSFSRASAAFYSGNCLVWERGQNTANAFCMPVAEPFRDRLTGFTAASFREDAAKQDRLFWIDHLEFPDAPQTIHSSHRVRQRRSTTGFSTSSANTLRECTTPSGFLTCAASSPIQTGKPPAVAWDDATNRSVFVWAHQNRLDDAASQRVRVAVGYVDDQTLPPAQALDVQTVAAPGVACKADQAGWFYDCIVAVVPQTDALFNVQIRRFQAQAGANGYTLVNDPFVTTLINTPTAGRIAVWYSDSQDEFFIAFRSLLTDQGVSVLSSDDTLSWTPVPFITYSDVGPSAVSYYTGDNSLLYVN
jgi:hypothetical protein